MLRLSPLRPSLVRLALRRCSSAPLSDAVAQLRTVPVPVVVGPAPAPPPPDASAADGLLHAASIADNGGGFFFSGPMWLAESGLLSLHQATGLPWWATIGLATVSVRLCLLPMFVWQQRGAAKMIAMKPFQQQEEERCKQAMADQDREAALDAKARLDRLRERFGVTSTDAAAPIVAVFVSGPVFITCFFTIQDMTSRPSDPLGLSSGGMLWFTDLCCRDPYYIVPFLTALSSYGMLVLSDPSQLAKKEEPTAANRWKPLSLLVMVPIFSLMNTGALMYALSNNIGGLLQSLIFASASTRRLIGIQPLPGNASILQKVIPQRLYKGMRALLRSSGKNLIVGDSSQPRAPLNLPLVTFPDKKPKAASAQQKPKKKKQRWR